MMLCSLYQCNAMQCTTIRIFYAFMLQRRQWKASCRKETTLNFFSACWWLSSTTKAQRQNSTRNGNIQISWNFQQLLSLPKYMYVFALFLLLRHHHPITDVKWNIIRQFFAFPETHKSNLKFPPFFPPFRAKEKSFLWTIPQIYVITIQKFESKKGWGGTKNIFFPRL